MVTFAKANAIFHSKCETLLVLLSYGLLEDVLLY